MRINLRLALVLLASFAPSVALSQGEPQQPFSELTLGQVDFPISCSNRRNGSSIGPSQFCIPFGTKRRSRPSPM